MTLSFLTAPVFASTFSTPKKFCRALIIAGLPAALATDALGSSASGSTAGLLAFVDATQLRSATPAQSSGQLRSTRGLWIGTRRAPMNATQTRLAEVRLDEGAIAGSLASMSFDPDRPGALDRR